MTSVQKQQFPGQIKELSLCIVMALPMLAVAQDSVGTLPEIRVEAVGAGETATSPTVGYTPKRAATATKTDTPLIETPQSVTVVTRDLMVDQERPICKTRSTMRLV